MENSKLLCRRVKGRWNLEVAGEMGEGGQVNFGGTFVGGNVEGVLVGVGLVGCGVKEGEGGCRVASLIFQSQRVSKHLDQVWYTLLVTLTVHHHTFILQG